MASSAVAAFNTIPFSSTGIVCRESSSARPQALPIFAITAPSLQSCVSGQPVASGWQDGELNGGKHGIHELTKQCVLVRRGRRASSKGCVTMSLPQARWSARALKAFGLSEVEAKKLKYPTTGTEALLIGILTEGTSHGAKYLRANGVRVFEMRDEVVELLGRADMFFLSEEHPPLTQAALDALTWAVEDHKNAGGEGEVGVERVVLGVWAQEESAGKALLQKLGFTEENAEELRKYVAEGSKLVAA